MFNVNNCYFRNTKLFNFKKFIIYALDTKWAILGDFRIRVVFWAGNKKTWYFLH